MKVPIDFSIRGNKPKKQLINEANAIIQAKDNQINELNRSNLHLKYRLDDLISKYAELSSENCNLKWEKKNNILNYTGHHFKITF